MAFAERLNARTVGNGPRTVVLGHGFGTDQTIWTGQQAALLLQGYRVVLFDMAGATEKTLPAYHPGRHCSLYGFAEDLIALMTELEIRNATYIGHSLGGMVGLLAGNGQPGMFDSLILLAASARYLDDPSSGYVGGFSHEDISLLVRAMEEDYAAWANGFAPLVVADNRQTLLAQEFTRRLLQLRPDIAASVLSTAFHSDHRRDAEQVAIPVRLLQTEYDPAVPTTAAQWLAEHCRAESLVMVPTHGHFPHLSATAVVNDSILDFLLHVARQ